MSTRAQIQAKIDLITTGGLNTAVEAVDIWEALENELFPASYHQVINTGTDKFYCDLYYKKRGNTVEISGTIQNKYSVAKSSVVMIAIPDSIYYAKTGQDTVVMCGTSAFTNTLVSFNLSNIYLPLSIAANQILYINHHYSTND